MGCSRCKGCIAIVFTWTMRILVFVLFGPFACLYYCFLRCKLAAQIRKLEGRLLDEQSQSSLKQLTSDLTTELTYTEELDFKRNRSRTYINQMSFGNLWEFSNLASRRQRIPLLPNYALHHVLFHSVFSYGLVREENAESEIGWRFSFDKMGQYKIFREFHWDVTEILIFKTGKLNIRDRTGRIHTPQCKTWIVAKAHVQAQLTCYAPGLAHNFAHSAVPSLIACEVRRLLPETSVLRQLLEPHTRFTQYINYQAPKECLQSFSSRPFYNCLFRPWLRLPTRKADVVTEIHRKREEYNNKVPLLDDDVPYQSFLKEYCHIFHDFVSALSPFLTSDYEILRPAIIKHVSNLAHVDMVNVISGILFNSCVVHHCDHESYVKQWGRRYGCVAVRKPLVPPQPNCNDITNEPTSSDRFIADTANKHVVIETYQYDSKKEGLKYFSPIDVCRTRCLIRTAVQYNENPQVNMKLFDTNYGFSDPDARKIAAKFMMEMKDLSSKLKQRGEAIVEGRDLIRSVCY